MPCPSHGNVQSDQETGILEEINHGIVTDCGCLSVSFASLKAVPATLERRIDSLGAAVDAADGADPGLARRRDILTSVSVTGPPP